VLIADDEPDQGLLEALIRDLGHEVETASNGLLALATALRFQPQIAFIDLGMPYRDGLTLARDLRKELPYIRLYAVTGFGAAEDFERSREAGFDDHLVKPFTFDLVEQLVTGG